MKYIFFKNILFSVLTRYMGLLAGYGLSNFIPDSALGLASRASALS